MHHIKPSIKKQDGRLRLGKGFSVEELKKAGLNKLEAKRMNIPVDGRRKTAHEANISELKVYREKKQAEAKPKPEPKLKEQPKKKTKK